jgi:uncharacterized protein
MKKSYTLMPKLFKIVGFSLLLLIFAIVTLLEKGTPYMILKPFRHNQKLHPSDFALQYDTLNVLTHEGYSLKGYLIKPDLKEPKAVIIMVHGISGCKERYLTTAKQMAAQSYASVIFDLRAHGESGGEFCTYGYFEKDDISKIINTIKPKYPFQPIGIWGNSLGGAIALQALARDKRLDFGIIESTFTDLDTIVYDYMKHRLHFQNRFLARRALHHAEEIAGFDATEVKPIECVKNIHQPILMAHGNQDDRIKVEYGKALFKNLASENKYLEIIEGAGHHNVGKIGGEAYSQKINDFLEKASSMDFGLHRP